MERLCVGPPSEDFTQFHSIPFNSFMTHEAFSCFALSPLMVENLPRFARALRSRNLGVQEQDMGTRALSTLRPISSERWSYKMVFRTLLSCFAGQAASRICPWPMMPCYSCTC